MPKKTASARGNVHRNRPKAQKSIQLVRSTPPVTERESLEEQVETSSVATSTAPAVENVEETTESLEPDPEPERVPAKRARSLRDPVAATVSAAPAPVAATAPAASSTAAPRSAAARMAARRQQQQKVQQRQAANLITAEHYSYVRRDLIFIAILAILMFGTLLVLHFIPAIGG